VGWLTGWFEHNQVVHAAWLGAVGTRVAAAFGVAAFIWQIATSQQHRDQQRRAQARMIWFLMGPTASTFSTDDPSIWRTSVEPIRVHNDSDEVIAWVQIEMRPVFQPMGGPPLTYTEHWSAKVTESTRRGVTMIGPHGHWDTLPMTIDLPNVGMDGIWLFECTVVFEDAAGVRWQRVVESHKLSERPKSRQERDEEQLLPLAG